MLPDPTAALPAYGTSAPLFAEERAGEALRILSRGLQMGGSFALDLTKVAPAAWEARIPGYLAHGGSSIEAARALVVSLSRDKRIGLADDALDALSEAYALVGNFDRSNWQTGEVSSC